MLLSNKNNSTCSLIADMLLFAVHTNLLSICKHQSYISSKTLDRWCSARRHTTQRGWTRRDGTERWIIVA